MGCCECRIRLTAVRRLCGQLETGPSGVRAQSCARIRRAISPSPGITACLRSSSACARVLVVGAAAAPGALWLTSPGTDISVSELQNLAAQCKRREQGCQTLEMRLRRQ